MRCSLFALACICVFFALAPAVMAQMDCSQCSPQGDCSTPCQYETSAEDAERSRYFK